MADSVRPHRWQPTRLPNPWDSPGKNTGVGCHFLFQCMKVNSESEVTQSCLTLNDAMDCSLPGSSIHGIFQARVLEWEFNASTHYLLSYLFKIPHCSCIEQLQLHVTDSGKVSYHFYSFTNIFFFFFLRC